MISKSDVDNWKHDPVTVAYFEACQERIQDILALLELSAGIEPHNDNFNRGFIAAYREKLNFHIEEEQ